jgi:hypothetical protein
VLCAPNCNSNVLTLHGFWLALTFCWVRFPVADWFESVDGAPQRGWLRSDVSIECYTPSHYSVMTLSWFAIITYPIGLWVGCLLLLYKASDAIVNREPTNFSRAIEFLYKEYDVRTFWWELMEMLRKFLLVGIFVIFDPGTILQIAVGTIVSAAYLVWPQALEHGLSSLHGLLMAHTASPVLRSFHR